MSTDRTSIARELRTQKAQWFESKRERAREKFADDPDTVSLLVLQIDGLEKSYNREMDCWQAGGHRIETPDVMSEILEEMIDKDILERSYGDIL